MKVRLAVFAAAAMLAAACGSSTGPSGTGRLSIRITDLPYDAAKAVYVTFTDVRVHRADGDQGWEVAFAGNGSTLTCDLKKLERGAQALFAAASLPEGNYNQLRLVVQSAKLFFENESDGEACAANKAEPNGTWANVTVPSGEVKLNRPFLVEAGEETTLTMDVDGKLSIHETGNGNYMMKPVVTIVGAR